MINPVYTSMLATALLLAGTLFVGRFAFGALARIEGYSFSQQLFVKNNPAATMRLCGMLAALFVATFGAYQPDVSSFGADIGAGVEAFVAAFVALTISRYVNDYIILNEVNNNEAVMSQQNLAVAIVECSTYLATAFIFAGGASDPDHGFVFNATWFVLGQVTLIALALMYRLLAPSAFNRIANGNVACALSLSGLLLSGGIAVGAVISGPFQSWAIDLAKVGVSLLIWLGLMGLSRIAFYISVISRSKLEHELAEEANWALGLADALVFVAFTAVFTAIHT